MGAPPSGLVLATTVSTVTESTAGLTLAPPAHARLMLLAPTRRTTSPASATTVSTSELTSTEPTSAGVMSVPAPTHATPTLPALTTLTVPRLALATTVTRETDLSASTLLVSELPTSPPRLLSSLRPPRHR